MTANFQEFQEAGAKLQDLGDRKLVLAMRRELRTAAKPASERILGAIADAMPARGGLADKIRSQGRISLLVDLRRGVRIQLANKAGMRMGAFEDGLIRHPTYGHRNAWVSQKVPADKGAEQFAKEADPLAATIAEQVAKTVRNAL